MTITRKKKRTFQSKSVEPLPLLDTQEPNLYRSIFPYDEVCRVEFDNKFVFSIRPRRSSSPIRPSGTGSRRGLPTRSNRSWTSSI